MQFKGAGAMRVSDMNYLELHFWECCSDDKYLCRRIDDDRGRTHELAQSAVKCMRGILECWLHQAEKVEKFKQSQTPKNSLHSVFHMVTGESIFKDDEYEHLQVRPVSLVHAWY